MTNFFRITLPLMLPGITGGWMLAFINSFDEVTMSIFITSPQTVTLPVPANGSASVSPATLAVGINIPSAGSYTLALGSATPALIRDTPGGLSTPTTSFPYTAGPITITDGSLAGYYYFFYDWSVQTGCQSARTAVTVNVSALMRW